MQKTALQIKILSIYAVMFTLAVSMASILLHERKRMKEIEAETADIRKVRRSIGSVHRHITELATMGEYAIAWEDADYAGYHKMRLHTDSLLQIMETDCRSFILPGQTDTLRSLLLSKEKHLAHIMDAVRREERADSLLLARMPAVARQAVRTRTVTRKKKGLAGWLGGKKTVQVAVPSKELQALSDTLAAMQQEHGHRIEAYTDSLQAQNKALNRELHAFITGLDRQALASFKRREEKISEARAHSYRLFAAALSVSLLLLMASYLTIQREIREKTAARDKREELIARLRKTVSRNEELTTARRNLIQTITHELRIPLTAICGSAELVKDAGDPERRIRHAETIRLSAGRMAGLIDSMLNYFRLDSGKETVNRKPFRSDSVAAILEAGTAPHAEAMHLRLAVRNS